MLIQKNQIYQISSNHPDVAVYVIQNSIGLEDGLAIMLGRWLNMGYEKGYVNLMVSHSSIGAWDLWCLCKLIRCKGENAMNFNITCKWFIFRRLDSKNGVRDLELV